MKLVQPNSPRKLVFILAPILLMIVTIAAWLGIPSLRRAVNPGLEPLSTQVSFERIESSATAEIESAIQEATSSPEPTASPSTTIAPISMPSGGSLVDNLNREGVLVMAMRDGAFIHLFAYHPIYLPFTRLTNTPWDDAAPALSPNGKRLAYSSRQNGYWDLFVLDLETGMRTRLTDTPDLETAPTWAPDGEWIAYQRFDGANLEIELLSINDPASGIIRLTDSPSLDYAPAWSPQGRQIAFVSNRTGEDEIWLADLDIVDGRFTNLSQSATTLDRSPVWSLDGSRLSWTAERDGTRRPVIWPAGSDQRPAQLPAEGSRLAWSPDGSQLFSVLHGPNQVDLTAYNASSGRISLQPVPMPGEIYGLVWVPGPLPAKLIETILQGDQTPPPALYRPILSKLQIAPAGRLSLVALEDVAAPQPMLHDAVDEAYNDLRLEVGIEAGWDVLSSLENAFVAVTTPNDPANEDEWMYTGRAFALNPLLMSAGWMTVAREDFGGQTYWRIYLKARYQDGSMGMPLTQPVFDLNARYSGNTRAFEQGGRTLPAPSGYWIDLTELAARYGWERLPSQASWRTYYPSIRFNQFAITGGLDWHAAMVEIYPPEALVTSTPQPTYTSLPTLTPETPVPTREPTLVPTITQIPTRRPTWTPLPNFSP
jgi:TolB protein